MVYDVRSLRKSRNTTTKGTQQAVLSKSMRVRSKRGRKPGKNSQNSQNNSSDVLQDSAINNKEWPLIKQTHNLEQQSPQTVAVSEVTTFDGATRQNPSTGFQSVVSGTPVSAEAQNGLGFESYSGSPQLSVSFDASQSNLRSGVPEYWNQSYYSSVGSPETMINPIHASTSSQHINDLIAKYSQSDTFWDPLEIFKNDYGLQDDGSQDFLAPKGDLAQENRFPNTENSVVDADVCTKKEFTPFEAFDGVPDFGASNCQELDWLFQECSSMLETKEHQNSIAPSDAEEADFCNWLLESKEGIAENQEGKGHDGIWLRAPADSHGSSANTDNNEDNSSKAKDGTLESKALEVDDIGSEFDFEQFFASASDPDNVWADPNAGPK